jgi:hypothetical protein
VRGIVGSTVTYHDDGSQDYVHDTVDNKFDRALTFDQMGRIATAKTGDEARGGTTADGPYNESFSYDAWNNMTNHSTRHWTENFGGTAVTYANDRHADWTYDAAGNATQQGTDTVFTFDAAGRPASSYDPAFTEGCGVSTPYVISLTDVNTFDGDGETTKLTETRHVSGGPSGFTTTKYYLRSRALGGEVVDLMNSSGTKTFGFVYADGELLAKQWHAGSTEKVLWEHTNPATGAIWHTDETGTLAGREELDPLGADVGIRDPYTSGTGGGGSDGTGDCEGSRFHTQRPAANDVDGSCVWFGMPVPCSMVVDLQNHGGGTIDIIPGVTDGTGRPLQLPKKDPYRTINDLFHESGHAEKNPMQIELSHRLSDDPSTAPIDDGRDDAGEDGESGPSALPNIGNAGDVTITADFSGPVLPTDSFQKDIDQAVGDAASILNSNDGYNSCAFFFEGIGLNLNSRGFAVKVLAELGTLLKAGSVPDRKTGIEQGDFMSVSRFNNVDPPYRLPAIGHAIVNMQGPFFATGKQFGSFDSRSPAGRALAILHELAHIVSSNGVENPFTPLIPNDKGNGRDQYDLSERNTALVEKACGAQLRALTNHH